MSKQKRVVSLILRLLLGLTFTIFGLNGFFHFIPMPPHEGAAAEFMASLAATGYMRPLLNSTEVLSGLLILSGWGLPLGLILLAPVLVNILLFHVILTPGEWAIALLLVAIELALAWIHRSAWRGILFYRPDVSARGSS